VEKLNRTKHGQTGTCRSGDRPGTVGIQFLGLCSAGYSSRAGNLKKPDTHQTLSIPRYFRDYVQSGHETSYSDESGPTALARITRFTEDGLTSVHMGPGGCSARHTSYEQGHKANQKTIGNVDPKYGPSSTPTRGNKENTEEDDSATIRRRAPMSRTRFDRRSSLQEPGFTRDQRVSESEASGTDPDRRETYAGLTSRGAIVDQSTAMKTRHHEGTERQRTMAIGGDEGMHLRSQWHPIPEWHISLCVLCASYRFLGQRSRP
jgi:hypothetical protein